MHELRKAISLYLLRIHGNAPSVAIKITCFDVTERQDSQQNILLGKKLSKNSGSKNVVKHIFTNEV